MRTLISSDGGPSWQRPRLVRGWAVLLLGLSLIPLQRHASAFELNFFEGALTGNLDTTISVGTSLRLEERDPGLVGYSNGGSAYSINGDNGNLNYDQWNVVSASAKATHEIELKWREFGSFVRFYYFYDAAVMALDTERTPLSDTAERYSGLNIKLLDAYATAALRVADRPVTLRLGNQVLSWGESTFIQNGINIINPVDVSQLRVAGAELREALLPVPIVDVNADIGRGLSVEGFYQLYWDNTNIEPEGTFFSTNDYASPGGRRVYLGFGGPRVPEEELPPPFKKPGPTDWPPTSSTDPDFHGLFSPVGTVVPRGSDREPSHQGQGGVALRYFSPELSDTEFGFYYVHYHSRLPVASGRSGDSPPAPARPGTNLSDWLALIRYGLLEGDYASTARYYMEYPEGIDMLGLSFNAMVGAIGLAVQGEVSYRFNQPLQVDDAELLFAALSPLDDHLKTLLILEGLLEGETVIPPDKIFANSQLGAYGFNEDIKGYRRKQVVQPQMTLTKILGPTLGADQIVLLGEAGLTWIPDLEPKSELRYDGPGTPTSGTEFFTKAIQPATQKSGFADDFSFGYRLALRTDFNNAIGPVNLQPAVAFSHDVVGTTPTPILNFVEGRMSVTATLGASYLGPWRASLSYTSYFGGGSFNLVSDRDFLSVTASYSF